MRGRGVYGGDETKQCSVCSVGGKSFTLAFAPSERDLTGSGNTHFQVSSASGPQSYLVFFCALAWQGVLIAK